MNLRMLALAVTMSSSLMVAGCVSSGKFEQKEQEALTLTQNLKKAENSYSELEKKQKELQSLNDELKGQVEAAAGNAEKLSSELVLLKSENAKLIADASSENLLKKIADQITEMKLKIEKLTTENGQLKKQLDQGKTPSTTGKTDVKPVDSDKQSTPEPAKAADKAPVKPEVKETAPAAGKTETPTQSSTPKSAAPAAVK